MVVLEQGHVIVPDSLIGVGKPMEAAASRIKEIVGSENLPTFSEFMSYMPRSYQNPDNPTHGLQHTGETTAIALIHARLAKALGYNVNLHVVGMAAGYHDIEHSGRIEDYDHGDLAALWFESNMDGKDVAEIAEIIRLHVPDDLPGLSDNARIVKDADSINRVRFLNQRWGLNTAFLRFDYAEELLVQPAVVANHRTSELLKMGYADGYVCAGRSFIDMELMQAP